jgi:hypothetical protein
MTSAADSQCSKAPGEHCRLHNPAFPGGFQPFNQTRKLAGNVPCRLVEHAKENRERAKHSLNENERIAVSHYPHGSTGNFISKLLRNPDMDVTYQPERPSWLVEHRSVEAFNSREELVSYIETMDTALSQRTENNRIVYRGIDFESIREQIATEYGSPIPVDNKQEWDKAVGNFYHKDRLFAFSNYTSTTLAPTYAAGWMPPGEDNTSYRGVVFEMSTNAGLDITGLGENNSYAHEREVLLPRDVYFKVVNVQIAPPKYDTRAGIETMHELGAELQEHKPFWGDIAAVVQMVEVDKHGNQLTPEARVQKHIPERDSEQSVPAEAPASPEIFYKEWLKSLKKRKDKQ